MRSLSFRECQKYIETIATRAVFSDLTGTEAGDKIQREDLSDEVLVVKSDRNNWIIGGNESGFFALQFDRDSFEKRESPASLSSYCRESHRMSLFQLDSDLLWSFLERDRQFLSVIHEEIDFELGFRLRKSYLEDPETVFAIFYWPQGPVLLCSRRGGEEIFRSSSLPENTPSPEVLQKVKEECGNKPCCMQILRKTPAPNPSFAPALEDDFETEMEEDAEEDILMVEMEFPSPKSSSAVKSEPGKVTEIGPSEPPEDAGPASDEEESDRQSQDIQKSLEDSVVIREEELPELGPQDQEILNKYGIAFSENEPPPKGTKATFAVDVTSTAIDQEIPAMNDKELEILKKYGIDVGDTQRATYREIHKAFEDSVILKEEELPPIKPEDASVLEKYGIILKAPRAGDKPAPALTAHDVEVLQKYGLKVPHGERSTLAMLQQSFQLAVAVKKLAPDIPVKDRPVFSKFGLKLPPPPLLERMKQPYLAIPLLLVFTMVLALMFGSWQGKRRRTAECNKRIEALQNYRSAIEGRVASLREIRGRYGVEPGELNLGSEQAEELGKVEEHLAALEDFIAGAKKLMGDGKIKAAQKRLAAIAEWTESEWGEKSEKLQQQVLGQADYCAGRLQAILQYRKDIETELAAIDLLGQNLGEKGPRKSPLKTDPATAEEWWQLQERLDDLDEIAAGGRHLLAQGNIADALSYFNSEKIDRELNQNWPAAAKKLCARIQGQIAFCEGKIRELKDGKEQCLQQEKYLRKVISELTQKYPGSQGYPEPNPKILKQLDQMGVFFEEVDRAIAAEKELLGKADLHGALSFWKTPQGRQVVDADWPKQLKRLEKLTASTLKTCESMEENRANYQKIREAIRVLREHNIALSQKLKSVEEDVETLNEKYPASQGFPPPPQEVGKIMEEARGRIASLGEAYQRIYSARLNENITEALKLAEPYATMTAVDVSEMEDVQEILRERISVSEQMAHSKAMRRRTLQRVKEFEEIAGEIANELYEIDKGSQKLQAFPEELEIPRPDKDAANFLTAARSELDNLQQFLHNGMEMLEQERQLEEAFRTVQSLEKGPFEDILLNLKKTRENVGDAIQIAKFSEKQDRQGKDIARLLRNSKEKLVQLESVTTKVSAHTAMLKSTYPTKQGYPAGTFSSKDYQKAENLEDKLRHTVGQAQDLIEKKQLAEALKLLTKEKQNADKASDAIEQLENAERELSSTIRECEKIAEERNRLGQVTAGIQKIQEYVQELQKNLEPLQNYGRELEHYPADEGYPAAPPQAGETALKAEALLKNLEQILSQLAKMSGTKNFDEADAQLESIWVKRMLDRDLITDVSKYRYRLEDMLSDARAMKENKEKVTTIKGYLEELRTREEKFQDILPSFAEAMKELAENYPPGEGYDPPHRDALSVFQECQEELKLLSDVIATGEKHFQGGGFERAIESLSPHSEKVNRGLSRLPALENLHKNLERTLQKNRALAQDSEKLKAKQAQEGEKKKRREEWKKLQPDWYRDLSQQIAAYIALAPKIENAIQDQGAYFLYTKTQVEQKELERFPDQIADLEEILYEIQQKKGNLKQLLRSRREEAMTPKQQEEIEFVEKYLAQHQIALDAAQEMDLMRAALPRIEVAIEKQDAQELKDSIKEVFKAMNRVTSKLEEAYRPIHSLLMNLKNSLPNK